MAWPEFSDLKTEVKRVLSWQESGVDASLTNLFNEELNVLATNARPLHWRNRQDRRFPQEGIIYGTIGTLYGVLADVADREPVLYIKTENVTEGSYEERYFIGLVAVGFRHSTDADLATFTDYATAASKTLGGVVNYSQDWNMLSDAGLLVWAAGAGGVYTHPDSLNWTPIAGLSRVEADQQYYAYDGHTNRIGSYAGVTEGEPAAYVQDWRVPLFGKTGTGNETNARGKQRAFVKIYPPPDVDYTFRCFYRRRPAALSADADENEITRRFPYLMVYRVASAVARGWLKDDARAQALEIEADNKLESALVHENDFMPTTGMNIAPGFTRYEPRRGVRQ